MGDGFTSTQVATVAGGTAVVGSTALAAGAAGATISVTVPTTVALAGGGTAVLGTTFTAGAANFWNPVGWALLIVAAVIAIVAIGIWIYENWDAICDFFSSIWAWFKKATIVYKGIMDTTVSWIIYNNLEKAWALATGAISITTTLTKPKTSWRDLSIESLVIISTLAGLIPDWNVYELYVGQMGPFMNYIRKVKNKPNKSHLMNLQVGDVYKYGITRFHTVKARYKAFSWITKENTIYEQLLWGELKSRWHLWHVFYPVARAKENALIIAYVASHGGEFPPGNTGLY